MDEIPVFDRLKQFDERSRQYPIRALLGDTPKKLRSYTWRCQQTLDQGREGACVGFSLAHELIARPSEVPGITDAEALRIYKHAQTLDPWDGQDYSGTSVLAGIKAVMELHPGKVTSYRWGFGIDDVCFTVSYVSPVVLGIDWTEGMLTPDENGVIRATGRVLGGHAILANGVNAKTRQVRLHNSWGKDYGKNGDVFISFDDLNLLLHQGGEACVPLGRAAEKRLPKAAA